MKKIKIPIEQVKFIKVTDIGSDYTTHPDATELGALNYKYDENTTEGEIYKVLNIFKINGIQSCFLLLDKDDYHFLKGVECGWEFASENDWNIQSSIIPSLPTNNNL